MTENAKTVHRHRQMYGTRRMLGAVDTDMGRQEIGQEGSTVWGKMVRLWVWVVFVSQL